jgi:regulator of sigma E protease
MLISLALFFLLILVHEFGHFVAAKFSGVKVREFSIGMGPVVAAAKKGDTLYSLRLVPLGGYNRMAGMEPDDMDDPKGFNRKSVPRRMVIIVAGSMMNFILAAVLYSVVFLAVGMPSDSPVIGKVVPGWPAHRAGLQEGDRIVAVDHIRVNRWVELVAAIRSNPEKTLTLVVERGRERFSVKVTPWRDPQTQTGVIGIEQAITHPDPFAALWQGIRQTGRMLVVVVDGFGQMLLGRVPVDLVGPVGIVQLVGQAARFGAASVLGFAAFISVNLGLINLFPIPALDGSRLVFLAIEAVRGRPVDPRKEGFVHLIGFAFLMLAILVITYRDLLRLLS